MPQNTSFTEIMLSPMSLVTHHSWRGPAALQQKLEANQWHLNPMKEDASNWPPKDRVRHALNERVLPNKLLQPDHIDTHTHTERLDELSGSNSSKCQ